MKKFILKIKQCLVLLLSLSSFLNLTAQELVFSDAFSLENSTSNSTNETVVGMDVDANGNLYISGHFRGTVDFDPGAGVTNLVAPNTSDNAYIAKYDATGALVFAKMISATTASAVRGNDIKVDAQGNIYVVVLSSATVSVDLSSVGGTTYTGSTLTLLKLDASGNLLWFKRNNGPTTDLTAKILTLDASQNNILVTGRYPASSVFDVGGENVPLTTTSGANAFILKYSTSGAFQWLKDFRTVSGSGAIWGTETAADDNSIYVTGFFSSTANFGGGQVLTPTGGSGEEAFIAKLDNVTGNTLWAFQIGSPTNDRGSAVKIDADGNLLTGGRFSQTANFNPNGTPVLRTTTAGNGSTDADAYVAKYDPNGLLMWVHTFGGAGFENIAQIDFDLNGEIYISGIFFGTVDMDPSTNDFLLTSAGSSDIFVLNLTSDGEFVDAVSFEGPSFDWSNSLVFDDSKDILYVCGAYRNTVDFDPNEGVFNLVNPSTSSDNGFVVALLKTIPTDTVPEIFCPDDITVGSNIETCDAEVFFADATAIDFEDGNLTVTQTMGPPSGSLFPLGETIIEFSTTDSDGNTATCQFTITVIDDVPPSFTTQDITVELDENGLALITFEDVLVDTPVDVCADIETGAVDIEEFSCADINNPVLVTVFVMDTNGNIGSATATVTVVDLLAPVIECPVEITEVTETTFTVPDYIGDGLINVTDNCTAPITIYSQTPEPGTILDFGTYTVTLDAEDEFGNSSSCNFQLIIEELLSTDENELNNAIILFPNPANEQIKIRNNSSIILKEASIYSINGQLVSKIDLSQSIGEHQLDVSNLATGVYILNISSDIASVAKQLIIK